MDCFGDHIALSMADLSMSSGEEYCGDMGILNDNMNRKTVEGKYYDYQLAHWLLVTLELFSLGSFPCLCAINRKGED